MKALAELLKLANEIQVLDIGAAAINEAPVYRTLIDAGMARLNAIEGDERQISSLRAMYGERATIFSDFVYDGSRAQVHFCAPESGMTSLLEPRLESLRFFNGFEKFGAVSQVADVSTCRVDDLVELPNIDFLKMDVQGAELRILQNSTSKLASCLAVQTEVSFFPLYHGQPSFGEMDVWMRANGFVPHCFLDVKRWSIAPTIFNDNFRVPGNQLREADIVYLRDPLRIDALTDESLKKFVAISHACFRSVDLCVHLLLALERRSALPAGTYERYVREIAARSANA